MKTDRYTKTILTIIAASLLWISMGGPSMLTTVQAQAEPQRVYIAGWIDASGAQHSLTNRANGRTIGLPVYDVPK